MTQDKKTFHLVITTRSHLSEFELGYKVEGLVRSTGLQTDLLIATALVNLCPKAGDVGSARKLFEGMIVRDVVAWNAVISGYSRAGFLSEAVGLYKNMRVVDGIWLLRNGKVIHGHVLNSLMAKYISCSHLDDEDNLFNGMVIIDAISWSTMIGGYVEHEHPRDAL